MPRYIVDVVRYEPFRGAIEVNAESPEEARRLAEEQAIAQFPSNEIDACWEPVCGTEDGCGEVFSMQGVRTQSVKPLT